MNSARAYKALETPVHQPEPIDPVFLGTSPPLYAVEQSYAAYSQSVHEELTVSVSSLSSTPIDEQISPFSLSSFSPSPNPVVNATTTNRKQITVNLSVDVESEYNQYNVTTPSSVDSSSNSSLSEILFDADPNSTEPEGTSSHQTNAYMCSLPDCQRWFADAELLKNHERSHETGVELSCTFCNRIFPTKRGLFLHTRIHSNRPVYRCQLCQSLFYQLGALTRHQLMQHGLVSEQSDLDRLADADYRVDLDDEEDGDEEAAYLPSTNAPASSNKHPVGGNRPSRRRTGKFLSVKRCRRRYSLLNLERQLEKSRKQAESRASARTQHYLQRGTQSGYRTILPKPNLHEAFSSQYATEDAPNQQHYQFLQQPYYYQPQFLPLIPVETDESVRRQFGLVDLLDPGSTSNNLQPTASTTSSPLPQNHVSLVTATTIAPTIATKTTESPCPTTRVQPFHRVIKTSPTKTVTSETLQQSISSPVDSSRSPTSPSLGGSSSTSLTSTDHESNTETFQQQQILSANELFPVYDQEGNIVYYCYYYYYNNAQDSMVEQIQPTGNDHPHQSVKPQALVQSGDTHNRQSMEKKFFDLDLPLATATPELVARSIDLGYNYLAFSLLVAIDQFDFLATSQSTASEDTPGRKKSKDERQSMRQSLTDQLKTPVGDQLENLLEKASKLSTNSCCLSRPRLFTRLTLTCDRPALAGHFFREFGSHLTSFDLVAFCPLSSDALTYVCDNQAIQLDLITLSPTSLANSVRLSAKQCKQLTDRGLHVELQYASLFSPSESVSANARSSMAYQFTHLMSLVRPSTASRLVVVSSSARSGIELRRPLALVSVLACLGLPVETALAGLTRLPCNAIRHGLTRSQSTHGAAALVMKLLPRASVLSIRRNKVEVASDQPTSGDEAGEPEIKRPKLT